MVILGTIFGVCIGQLIGLLFIILNKPKLSDIKYTTFNDGIKIVKEELQDDLQS